MQITIILDYTGRGVLLSAGAPKQLHSASLGYYIPICAWSRPLESPSIKPIILHYIYIYTMTFLAPLIGDTWSLIVGIQALIEGRRRV